MKCSVVTSGEFQVICRVEVGHVRRCQEFVAKWFVMMDALVVAYSWGVRFVSACHACLCLCVWLDTSRVRVARCIVCVCRLCLSCIPACSSLPPPPSVIRFGHLYFIRIVSFLFFLSLSLVLVGCIPVALSLFSCRVLPCTLPGLAGLQFSWDWRGA